MCAYACVCVCISVFVSVNERWEQATLITGPSKAKTALGVSGFDNNLYLKIWVAYECSSRLTNMRQYANTGLEVLSYTFISMMQILIHIKDRHY